LLLADVNVFLYAFRTESSSHGAHRDWLTSALTAPEPFGVSDVVLSSFLRIVTNHRVYVEPTSPERALEFCDTVLGAPSAVPVRPGPGHWEIFSGLVRAVGARANVIPDAWLAALAVEHGATWITTDAGFARFPGLKWRRPLVDAP
jgi:toxin-antitoxin system PIN domain toxin